MSEGRGAASSSENVAEDWEEAGDEVSAQLEQRQKLFLKKKQKEEELAKARQEAVLYSQLHSHEGSSGTNEKQATFKILRRPQSYGTIPSSSKAEPVKSDEDYQSKKRSLEERQAAYQQARERIFGGQYNPDEEPDPEELGPTIIPLPPTTANSPTGMLGPRIQYTAPVPRPRAPTPLQVRAQHYPSLPVNQGAQRIVHYGNQAKLSEQLSRQGVPFVVPPPPIALQMSQQQKYGLKSEHLPFFDARIPPPLPAVGPTSIYPAVVMTSGVTTAPSKVITTPNDRGEQSRGSGCSSVPYGWYHLLP
ncbi:hypothetical protein AB6A40_005217 [Gnathostoma spinigerum]|uniref:SUZ domain-containing protein n=1 Tax=Gnathostoma spinigerum TaxID=75299 RepID=A0ABD6ENF5_9BILA